MITKGTSGETQPAPRNPDPSGSPPPPKKACPEPEKPAPDATVNSPSSSMQERRNTLSLDLTTKPEASRRKAFAGITPDVSCLLASTPDLERLLAQGAALSSTTPTPTKYFYPKFVTQEQEEFSQPFSEALNQMHKTYGYVSLPQILSPGVLTATLTPISEKSNDPADRLKNEIARLFNAASASVSAQQSAAARNLTDSWAKMAAANQQQAADVSRLFGNVVTSGAFTTAENAAGGVNVTAASSDSFSATPLGTMVDVNRLFQALAAASSRQASTPQPTAPVSSTAGPLVTPTFAVPRPPPPVPLTTIAQIFPQILAQPDTKPNIAAGDNGMATVVSSAAPVVASSIFGGNLGNTGTNSSSNNVVEPVTTTSAASVGGIFGLNNNETSTGGCTAGTTSNSQSTAQNMFAIPLAVMQNAGLLNNGKNGNAGGNINGNIGNSLGLGTVSSSQQQQQAIILQALQQNLAANWLQQQIEVASSNANASFSVVPDPKPSSTSILTSSSCNNLIGCPSTNEQRHVILANNAAADVAKLLASASNTCSSAASQSQASPPQDPVARSSTGPVASIGGISLNTPAAAAAANSAGLVKTLGAPTTVVVPVPKHPTPGPTLDGLGITGGTKSVPPPAYSQLAVSCEGALSDGDSLSADDVLSPPLSLDTSSNSSMGGSGILLNSSSRGIRTSNFGTSGTGLPMEFTGQINVIDARAQERLKLERKRARNRAAATRCRTRKLEKIRTLEEKVADLERENDVIADKLSKVSRQRDELQRVVQQHTSSGCSFGAE